MRSRKNQKKHLEVNEKHKMNLGQMFEDQSVGKPGNQNSGNPEIKKNHTDGQPATHEPFQPNGHSLRGPPSCSPNYPRNHLSKSPSAWTSGNPPYWKGGSSI